MSISYATVAELDEIPTDYPGGVTQTAKEHVLERASRIIDAYCRRRFEPVEVEGELHDGTGGPTLTLFGYPVISVERVEVTDGTVAGTRVLDAGDLLVDAEAGVLVLREAGAAFPLGVRNVAVDYTYGYATVPSPVKEACLLVARKILSAHYHPGRDDYSASAASAKRWMPEVALVLDREVRSLLDPYRRVGAA